MKLVKNDKIMNIGDEIYYRGKSNSVTLITENYITINPGRTIKVAYDSNGFPKIVNENIGKQIRIPMENLKTMGWSVKHGN